MERDGLVETAGGGGVGDEVSTLGPLELDLRPKDDASQADSRDRRPEQLALGVVGAAGGGQGEDASIGHQQRDLDNVLAEGSGAVMILAMDVVRDGSTDGDLPGARQHRNPQTEREGHGHQLIEGDSGVEVDDPGGVIDRVDALELRHVDGQATDVLRGFVVGTSQSAGDHAATQVGRLVGVCIGNLRDSLGDHLDIGCRQHVTLDRRRAAPADELAGFNGQFSGRHRSRAYRACHRN